MKIMGIGLLLWLLMMMKHVVGTSEPKVLGLRLTSVDSNMGYTSDGVISVVTGVDLNLELIGVNINKEGRGSFKVLKSYIFLS